MAEPLAKKRKLNASPALQKPFKSPLGSSTGRQASSPSLPSSPLRQQDREINSFSSPLAPSRSAPSDPETAILGRQHSELIRDLRAARSELETIMQALKIEETNLDVQLKRCIDTWKIASQNAAEEIFGTVRDKVNKMGGVVAWRKKERERQERLEEWAKQDADEEEQDDDDDDLSGDDEDEDGNPLSSEECARRREARELAHEAKMAAREAREVAKAEAAALQGESAQEKQPQEEFAEDEAFTMDMMLRDLKIDPSVIGFDVECQRWVE